MIKKKLNEGTINTLVTKKRFLMSLKETFLSYVELQRSANQMRDSYGADDIRTVEAYQKANEKKKQVLEEIEKSGK